ncbi:16S rRNA (cytosine(967)-C(5))-methyltransferase RsmB [Algicola sagamiensis]|uniref:16S rRNA (cytosine(967)-C(5))-methyltransferase RsmB n=1 Tax=Algicola sagamiensis TaxID=163869 RepID=UPI00037A254B|nr:16S rRNA (cytosine(967)-C(5))-methyltransferase RsmB [Algicola sagamiensis]
MSAKIRAYASQVCFEVVDEGRSLSAVMPEYTSKVDPKDRGLLQEISYGVIRYLPQMEYFSRQLMKKPLKGKQRSFQFLIYVGLYQLMHMRVAEHAAVAETVNATKVLKAPGLKGLVNAVLRSFQRQKDELIKALDDNEVLMFNHPGWFIKVLKGAYPEGWQSILEQNQSRAPMWLRINQQAMSSEAFCAALDAAGIEFTTINEQPQTVCLKKPMDVTAIPGFEEGHFSVQDAAAQWAATFMDPKDNERILDACAAPGGKTCHLLESAKNLDVVALDQDPKRLERVQNNLERLSLGAELIAADVTELATWWDGQQFDRILLDAPCSATGVIRRHPDIKWLRRSEDIPQLADLQSNMLNALWQTLKPGGTLLYATCSIFPEENTMQIVKFLESTQDAVLQPISSDETSENPGWQILPGQQGMDGFYYARIIKADE